MTESTARSDAMNVIILERKLHHLEKQMNNLKDHVTESERKVAVEKRRKLDSKFKQKFKQQKLPAWQPILTADTVLPAFFLIGLLFIPLGVALLYFSNNVQEIQINYTKCAGRNYGGQLCQDIIEKPSFNHATDKCMCEIEFVLDQPYEKNVYMYYGLDNYYQNHRRYVKSRDDNQVYGKQADSVDSSCSPFDEENAIVFAPCGAIANSLFNDTLEVLDRSNNNAVVRVLNTDIAWPSDKSRKFNNPPGSHTNGSADFAFKNTQKPKYWNKAVWQLDDKNGDWSNNGYENEDLIVWMRTAAFPNFRKLYRRVDHDQTGFKTGMPQGNYTLQVTYNYPVKSFGGSKRFIISTTSFLGGKNNFLGIAYIVVGALCLLLGVIFLIIHIKYGKRPSDLQNITQNTPYFD